MEALTWAAGLLVMALIVAIFFFLAAESRYAFERTFPYGYRVALLPADSPEELDLSTELYASFVGAHHEGADGLDEREEVQPLPTLEELGGTGYCATGSPLTDRYEGISEDIVYRDDWRAAKTADKGDRFFLYGFATPEYKADKMLLAWEPDAAFDPKHTPYDIRLRLARAPKGVKLDNIEVDLKSHPKGKLLLPTYIASSDAERLNGYVFEVVATPTKGNFLATWSSVLRSDWAPTLQYPRFGFFPLLLGTLLMSVIAVLLATPLALAAAIYVAELAPARLREWMKPTIELLASIPTVVLGYFGLMLFAPWLVRWFGEALHMSSGRSMLTASLVLALLILPTIITIAEDAIRAVPRALRDGAEALGLTAAEGIRTVLLPAARAGVIAAILLGTARAVGETMIVWILSGGTARMLAFGNLRETLGNLVQPTRGIPDTIAIEMGNVEFEGPHYGHLFLIGLVLFLLTLVVNLAGFAYGRRAMWRTLH